MKPIVIIGTGLAGYSVARELRKHDSDTPLVLVTRDDGAHYYKPDISEALGRGLAPQDLVKRDAAAMAEELAAEIRTYVDAEAIDATAGTVTVSGEVLAYRQLVLAWGACPIDLALGGDAPHAGYQINNLLDYRHFRQVLAQAEQIAILGAGLIGSEFANDLVRAGHGVTAIDPLAWPLANLLPQACGEALRKALADDGVDYHLGETAEALDADGNGYRVTLSNGRHVDSALVISAVGLRPRTALAEAAGLAVERGIVVDRQLRTSDANIFALGDCMELEGFWLPYVMPLMAAARALGKTLAGEATALNYPVMPVTVKTPALATLVYPARHAHGEWRVTGSGRDLEARFEDRDATLQGFALTGAAVDKRRDYIRAAPPVLA